ncbi:hypothetical protein N7532_009902 [Penicillium argentinense]|uniref:Uncharacterized protein n=1 Tax=Penicillium argentinense TaxID=1131581 RepID=A0A9W9ENN6_9EURO|nr:uncharacterized protein N7532_009902 [Penicillium argentinense]KAJ5085131.1 hypothetical protein N7532_009902 [Penicillium argentinense]
MACPVGSDNTLGPRISVPCRPFDFTLLFEDGFFILLPAFVFLLCAVFRLAVLLRAPVKVTSHRLATAKIITLCFLLVFHVLYLAFQLQASILHTKASLGANILQLIAIAVSTLLSWLEDQRSIRPSDLLIIYFFFSGLLALPRLRSLWLLSSQFDIHSQATLWTVVSIGTVVVLCLESIHKTQHLRLSYRQPSKESTSSFWVRSFFIWVLPLFRSGFSTVISLKELPVVDHALQGIPAEEKLHLAWKRGNCTGSHRLLQATFRAYFWPFISAVLPQICLTAFTFCQPFLISATINFISEPSTSENRVQGPALVGAYVLVYMGMTISKAVYWRQTFRLVTMIRGGLISLIYRQTAKLPAEQFKGSSSITLISTDVERLSYRLRNLHEAWMGPIQVVVAIVLLERQLGVACLIPAAISFIAIAGTIPVSTKSNTAQRGWIERVQDRLAVISSMLQDMKSVKMLGISEKLFDSISGLRKKELQVSERFRILILWELALSNLPLTLAPFATFVIFAIIATATGGESLLSNRMFTSLSLISLMTSPLLTFTQAVPGLWQSVGCFDRIEQYCTQTSFEEESDYEPGEDGIEMSSNSMDHLPQTGAVVLQFQKASLSWSADTDSILHDINLSFKKGAITAIIGPVGSGKSTLLECALGEAPWIINNTIRNNITGPEAYDEKWYNFVIWACSLEDDLRNIPSGDLSGTGSSGITLSGGQKQRISLARAVYSRASVVILDDVFSGLDTRAVAAISSRLFATDGHFKQAGRTVILATHNYRLLPYVDEVVALNDGRVSRIGTYEELRTTLPEDSQSENNQDLEGPTAANRNPTNLTNVYEILQTSTEDSDPDMARRDGKWSVYAFYFESAGWWIMILVAVCVGIYGFSDKFSTIWLQQWSNANDLHPNERVGFYVGVYTVLLTMSLVAFMMGTWFLFVKAINNTGLAMHSHLLKSTLGAPFSFFQNVDAGMTINRFSQDLELIDLDLPIELINSSGAFANCAVELIILCVMGKYLAITVPALGIILFFVQSYYLRTSRQVRLLDIEAKSPLITHFVETMQGISVIRAMRWQEPFQDRLNDLLNQSQQPFYMLSCIQQWLQLVLDCIVMALAVILVSIVISLKDQFSPGAIGVALNLILSFNQDLMHLIRSWTQLETSIGAVSRIQDFVENTASEDLQERRPESVLPQWPTRGDVSFQEVTASYNDRSPPVLHNFSLDIQAGEKLAVCGPSGSGKTSLILGLLQMIELQEGRMTIDGVDLSTLPCDAVRSRINVVPQDPFFMPGTLRFNLDRGLEHCNVSDDRLIRALEAVGLWKKVSGSMPSGQELDQQLSVSDWSMGERQLLALARALVMDSSILILDEASSSVDWETEATMQAIIETEFASQTVISVIHRLRYIERFDRVALLKNGQLLECDSPQALLKRPSEFQSFYRARQAE